MVSSFHPNLFSRNLIHPLDIFVYVVDVILFHYCEQELVLPSALSCHELFFTKIL
jgi:hypothetical protein